MITKHTDFAFPVFDDQGGVEDGCQGLSKREYFAAIAMQGLCSGTAMSAATLAQEAVKQADALIEALNA